MEKLLEDRNPSDRMTPRRWLVLTVWIAVPVLWWLWNWSVATTAVIGYLVGGTSAIWWMHDTGRAATIRKPLNLN